MDRMRAALGDRYDISDEKPYMGGSGMVCRARDMLTGYPVVIKRLREEYATTEDYRNLLRNEAMVLEPVVHPAVVGFHDIVETPWNVYLILAFLPGRTLRQVIVEDGPMPKERVFDVLVHLCDGLDPLHRKGLVHLDVKPENAILQPTGQVTIFDFGTTQEAGRPQVHVSGKTLFTPSSMAPERATGENVVIGTDVYSLGFVMYELLTGQPPFSAPAGPQQADQLIDANLHATPLPPTVVRPDLNLPTWIDAVVLRAMAKSPDHRYPDVREFVQAFEAGLAAQTRKAEVDETVPVAPESLVFRLVWSRWHRWLAASAIPSSIANVSSWTWRDTWHRLYRAGGEAIRGAGWLSWLLWRMVAVVTIVTAILGGILAVDDVLAVLDDPDAFSTTVLESGYRLRPLPHRDAGVIARLDAGTAVDITGASVAADDHVWWPVSVELSGLTFSGWIAEAAFSDVPESGEPALLRSFADGAHHVRDGILEYWPFSPVRS